MDRVGQVTIHTDTLNESGCLEETQAAFKVRPYTPSAIPSVASHTECSRLQGPPHTPRPAHSLPPSSRAPSESRVTPDSAGEMCRAAEPYRARRVLK